jgi:hypothetical protein
LEQLIKNYTSEDLLLLIQKGLEKDEEEFEKRKRKDNGVVPKGGK